MFPFARACGLKLGVLRSRRPSIHGMTGNTASYLSRRVSFSGYSENGILWCPEVVCRSVFRKSYGFVENSVEPASTTRGPEMPETKKPGPVRPYCELPEGFASGHALKDLLGRMAGLASEANGWTSRSEAGRDDWAQELRVSPRPVRNRRRALRKSRLLETRRYSHCVNMRLTNCGSKVPSEYLYELQQSGASLARALIADHGCDPDD
jgi:hypothetical protein